MDVLPLSPGEARALVEGAANAQVDLSAGREFWFDVELATGEVVSGRRDTSDETTLTLLDARSSTNERRTVDWDAVMRICVSSHA